MFNPTAQEKKAFAERWLDVGDPFKAGCELFEDNINKALWAATHWVKDPEILKLYEEYKNGDGLMEKLPSKAELAADVFDRMQRCRFPEDYERLAKLYANIRGFIEKPQPQTNNTVTAPTVMIVKDHGSNDNWEAKAAEQQKKLTQGNINHGV